MKLITLNLWGGRVNKEFEKFFGNHSHIDAWCFQEVFHMNGAYFDWASMIRVPGFEPDVELFTSLKNHLPKFQDVFCPTFKETYGIATYLRPGITVHESGEILVAKGDWETDPETRDHDRKIQWMNLIQNGKQFVLINTHLTHRPVGKLDSDKRLKQSEAIAGLITQLTCPVVLVGDFNLMPDTQSIQIIEDVGMINLVKKYGVTSTRTELYTKPWRFADYIFVSKGITVKDFRVLPDVVSDHSPLFIDFDIDL